MNRPYKLIQFQGDWIIVPAKPLYCVFCEYSELLFHDYLVQHASQGFYHADIHMKCKRCGWYVTFGIPISHEEYEKLKNSKWHRKILLKELWELTLDDEVKERLKRWGYW